MSKLNSVCFAIRPVISILSQETLIIIYALYIHSIIIYGIFCENLPSALKYSGFKEHDENHNKFKK
jgi:hypothetical protein